MWKLKLWCITLAFWFANSSCHSPQKQPADPYQERVENLLQVLPDIQRPETVADSCFTVYLLQTTRCNVCSQQAMDELARSAHHHQVVFVMADSAENVKQAIRTYFQNDSVNTVFVDENTLTRKGLLFYKNVKADICRGHLTFWTFL